ncbi:MAG: GTP cyclohydrolase I FolE2 [Deltaproteobacteria bacterium]|nr:MAG: GTP cyclohydrolase I FolE2 [Deltaproteobacteria bacterium]
MQDIQSGPSMVPLAIDRVGVKNLTHPLIVRDRQQGQQHTVATMDLSVDLPAAFKGTHMSRFLEALGDWSGILDYASFRQLLEDLTIRLQAQRAHLCFTFPYFREQTAPVSKSPALMDYQCLLQGKWEKDRMEMILEVDVPVMTVCPCSLAICERGAHSQRAVVKIATRFSGLLWIEDLIDIGQGAGSSAVYPLLKREDEKDVTDTAFTNAAFVEDVVRKAAQKLAKHPQVHGYRVEVESMESIHNHSAYACIETM